MKRIFPIITVLILLSLLGLIFFQFLWIKSARDAKDKQIEENIVHAMNESAQVLMQERGPVVPNRRNDLIFPTDKLQMQ